MKVEYHDVDAGGENIYKVEFEVSPQNGLHEAYVALNAIASRNRQSFDDEPARAATPREVLKRSSGLLLNSGIDVFAPAIQKMAREKSREGLLSDTLHMQAVTSNLDYLHEALVGYRDGTHEAVTMELRGSSGNMSALTRTLEGITADAMVHILGTELGIEDEAKPTKPPIGFGRVLFTDHEG